MTPAPPLDILYVGTLPPHPGGSAISAALLLGGLARQGHAVRCLAGATSQALSNGDPFVARHPELHVTRYPLARFETTPYLASSSEDTASEKAAIERLLPAMIAERRPDLLFIGRETYAWLVPDIAERCGLPFIIRIAGGTLLGVVRGSYPETAVQALLAGFRKAERLVTPARHLKTELERLGMRNVQVIINAVDTAQFRPAPRGRGLLSQWDIAEDAVVMACIANLHQRKRPMDVLHSAAAALRQDSRLIYLIVGDGPLRGAMEDFCRQHGMSARFRFTGWVDYERVPDYMNLADVVILPSDGEGLARVYIETQACGRVLLASDIPPAREVVEHGDTGLLFRLGDVADLTEQTLLAAADPALRARIGAQARKRVLAHSLDKAVDAYGSTMRGIARQ